MIKGVRERHFLNGKGGRLGRRGRAGQSRRAVSDVVATILLLALTVVLFASIFAFVTQFPAPPAQNSNQFQATLTSAQNGSCSPTCNYMVASISIQHLSGPAVPLAAQVYLKSSAHPTGPEFATPYSLAAGGLPAGRPWNLGQTWVLNANFTGGLHPQLPDNITIYIVSTSNLLFSVILPGQVISQPPTFLSVGTTPAVAVVGGAFSIYAQIQGVVPPATAVITVSGLPGMSAITAAQKMTYSAGTGLWTYAMASGNTTASGTFYAFITATTAAGKVGTSAVTVSITPYTTLISNALTLGAISAPALCTAAAAPAAACRASGDYYVTVAISSSTVTFGSVQLEVWTSASKVAYATVLHSAFAVAATAAPTTLVASWIGPATGPLLMPPGFTAYTAPATVGTALTSSYVFSVDLGTTNPAANTLAFVVFGIGSYSGQTTPLTIT
jgi:hypothetical protein